VCVHVCVCERERLWESVCECERECARERAYSKGVATCDAELLGPVCVCACVESE